MQTNVEVSDEIITTGSGARMQVCYIDLGNKYPDKVTRFLPKGENPLPAGNYIATQGRIDSYRPVIDVQSLTRAK